MPGWASAYRYKGDCETDCRRAARTSCSPNLSLEWGMRVRVLFFGQLKEITGVSQKEAELSDGACAEDLFERQGRRFPRLAEIRASAASPSCISRMTIIKTSTSYFACARPATTAANLSSISTQPSSCPLFFACSMVSFPIKVTFVWPFPKSSKITTSFALSMASCSIP